VPLILFLFHSILFALDVIIAKPLPWALFILLCGLDIVIWGIIINHSKSMQRQAHHLIVIQMSLPVVECNY